MQKMIWYSRLLLALFFIFCNCPRRHFLPVFLLLTNASAFFNRPLHAGYFFSLRQMAAEWGSLHVESDRLSCWAGVNLAPPPIEEVKDAEPKTVFG